MPYEFNSRIDAQRQILRIVNAHEWKKEELLSLSRRAIERWVNLNRLDADGPLVRLLVSASAKLFFLANKSQEQISDEYCKASVEIGRICIAIERELGISS